MATIDAISLKVPSRYKVERLGIALDTGIPEYIHFEDHCIKHLANLPAGTLDELKASYGPSTLKSSWHQSLCPTLSLFASTGLLPRYYRTAAEDDSYAA